MTTAERLLNAKTLEETRAARFAGRKRLNFVALTLSLAAMAFGVFWSKYGSTMMTLMFSRFIN